MGKIKTIKKTRRKCMVRGCKCLDTYNVSCLSEIGFSVIICKECVKSILEELERQEEKANSTSAKVEAKAEENKKKNSKKKKGEE